MQGTINHHIFKTFSVVIRNASVSEAPYLPCRGLVGSIFYSPNHVKTPAIINKEYNEEKLESTSKKVVFLGVGDLWLLVKNCHLFVFASIRSRSLKNTHKKTV